MQENLLRHLLISTTTWSPARGTPAAACQDTWQYDPCRTAEDPHLFQLGFQLCDPIRHVCIENNVHLACPVVLWKAKPNLEQSFRFSGIARQHAARCLSEEAPRHCVTGPTTAETYSAAMQATCACALRCQPLLAASSVLPDHPTGSCSSKHVDSSKAAAAAGGC